jgi:hypothetical protein
VRVLILVLAAFIAGCSASRGPEPASGNAVRFHDDPFLGPHADPTYEAYRFHDFARVSGTRVAILAEKTATGGVLRVWTALDGYRGNVAVTREEWNDLARALDDAGFWSMPESEPEELRLRGRDGCSWAVEGVRGAERHGVGRSLALSRSEERGLAQLVVFARRLLQLARVNGASLCMASSRQSRSVASEVRSPPP